MFSKHIHTIHLLKAENYSQILFILIYIFQKKAFSIDSNDVLKH